MDYKAKINKLSITRILIGVVLVFSFSNKGFTQKLKKDGYKIAINKNAKKKQTNMHGKMYVSFKGTLKVNSKDSLKGTYQFAYIELGNYIAILTFKSDEGKTLPPKLQYEGKTGLYSYNKAKGGEEKVPEEAFLSLEDSVLKGMLLWLKIKNQLPLD